MAHPPELLVPSNRCRRASALFVVAALVATPSIASSQAPTRLGGEWSYIGSLVPLGDERIAISQPQERTIVLVNTADGATVTIGRRGEGPGEFRTLGRLAAHPLGFAAFDASLRRITVFSREGKLVRTESAPPVNSAVSFEVATLTPVHRGTGGALLAVGTLRRDGLAAGEAMGTVVYLASRDSGGAWREIARTTARPVCRILTASVGAPVPLCEHPLSAVHPDGNGVVLLEPMTDPTAPLQLRSVAANGARRFVVPLSLQQRPVPRRVRDSITSHLEGRFAGVRLPEAPRHYPRARRVVAGVDGSVWVQETPTGGQSRWVGVDAQGRRIGTMVLPASARVLHANTQYFWVALTDEDDLESLERVSRGKVTAEGKRRG